MRVAMVILVMYFLAVRNFVWTEEMEKEENNENSEKEIEQQSDSEIEKPVSETESEEIEKEDEKEDRGEEEDGFSFHKFTGPVSGEVRKVVVPNSNPLELGSNSIDYIGKPDYSFGYGVHDDKSKNSHLRVESRDGNAVHGEYRVLQPDGLVRIVKYSAHPTTGFQAHVSYVKY